MSNALADAEQLLSESFVFDGLGGSVVNPTPHVSEGTYEELMLSQGWSAFNACLVSQPSYTPTWEEVQTALFENLAHLANTPKLRLCERPDDLLEAERAGQLGIVFGLQSPSCIEADRTRLRLLHKLGLRILQLTYMERNRLGDGCLEPENRGLFHYGIQVVRECNLLGIVIDCSHVGIQTTLDAARYSADPIVISHTAARALTDNPRCVTDEMIKAVADKGGLAGITPYAPFIRFDRRPVLEDYLQHFDHMLKLVGPDHVAIATDMFDGKTALNWVTSHYYPEMTKGAGYATRRVLGFERKADLAKVVAGFLERGYPPDTIRKILGGNWIRVIRAVWK